MILVVADASVLVGELLRERGRALVSHPDLRVVVPEHQWHEAEYELQRRIATLVTTTRLSSDHGDKLLRTTLALAAVGVVEVVPAAAYSDLEAIARNRVTALMLASGDATLLRATREKMHRQLDAKSARYTIQRTESRLDTTGLDPGNHRLCNAYMVRQLLLRQPSVGA